jgi:ferredoxin
MNNPNPSSIIKDLKSDKKNIEVTEISPGIYRATSKNSNYIIEYDKNKCIGAASCAALAPLTFFMNDEDLAEIRMDVDDFDSDEEILEGAQSCPVFAIKLIDKTTNEVVFPFE